MPVKWHFPYFMLLKRRLENLVMKKYEIENGQFALHNTLKNIRVNGVARGCSGHFVNDDTGICVYVDTERSVLASLSDKILVRFAKSEKDFSSINIRNGYNQWVSESELPGKIFSMLRDGK